MKPVFCILIAGLISNPLRAQQNNIEPSHYLFPEFKQGVILMKDGQKNGALLNYNALTEEMIFDKEGRKRAIAVNEIPLIDTVFIGDRKFLVTEDKFVEVIHHGAWDLYVEHKCKVEEPGKPAGYGGTSQTGAATSVSSLYSQGRVVYNLKLPDGYTVKPFPIYWLKKNSELIELKSMREIKQAYKDRKDLYKKYLKSNRVSYQDPESILQLIEYMEAN